VSNISVDITGIKNAMKNGWVFGAAYISSKKKWNAHLRTKKEYVAVEGFSTFDDALLALDSSIRDLHEI
jgi:hypothetical protein